MRIFRLVLFCWAALAAVRADAADLTIGTRAEPTIDPHFLYLSTNIAFARHLFDPIVDRDADVRRQPGLALSWRPLDETTWEFKLREGVVFHDGSPFTAEDIAFTMRRIPSLPNNPNPYTGNIRSVIATEIVDPYTVRFKTDRPNPSLPGQLSNVFVVSHKAAEGALPGDFASGKAAVGTGPFKFVSFAPGDRLVLQRNDAYWGAKPVWNRVTFRVIPNDASRVAALLAGDVQIADFLPPADVVRLEKNDAVRVFKRPSDRIIYLAPNVSDEKLGWLVDKAGNPLDRNPLQDVRVRQAIAKAINREAMTRQVLEGLGVPASQLVPEGFSGFNPAIPAERHDPDGARKLLAAAGWPEGFGITVHCTSDRYVNDGQVCQAVGQMLSRIGIATKVQTAPGSVFFPKVVAPKPQYQLMLGGWGSASTGGSVSGLTGVLHSYDKDKGMGAYNWGIQRNVEFDGLVEKAIVTLDDASRETLLKDAMALAMRDYLVIPLHTQMSIAAARKGIEYRPRADEQTTAMQARPAQ